MESEINMVFISGIHGVGKSYFCNCAKEILHINTYSASSLIEQGKHINFSRDKLISDIDDNQAYLIKAVQVLKEQERSFLLEGHFCLLNENGVIERIPAEIFLNLCPRAIVLLIEEPEIIANRRKERDGVTVSVKDISDFQKEEVCYAKEIAKILEVELKISKGANDLEDTLRFIKNTI